MLERLKSSRDLGKDLNVSDSEPPLHFVIKHRLQVPEKQQ